MINLLTKAKQIVGTTKLVKGLGVTLTTFYRWEKAGRLPRTEWTGESNYSSKIEELTEKQVTRDQLLSAFKKTA